MVADCRLSDTHSKSERLIWYSLCTRHPLTKIQAVTHDKEKENGFMSSPRRKILAAAAVVGVSKLSGETFMRTAEIADEDNSGEPPAAEVESDTETETRAQITRAYLDASADLSMGEGEWRDPIPYIVGSTGIDKIGGWDDETHTFSPPVSGEYHISISATVEPGPTGIDDFVVQFRPESGQSSPRRGVYASEINQKGQRDTVPSNSKIEYLDDARTYRPLGRVRGDYGVLTTEEERAFVTIRGPL